MASSKHTGPVMMSAQQRRQVEADLALIAEKYSYTDFSFKEVRKLIQYYFDHRVDPKFPYIRLDYEDELNGRQDELRITIKLQRHTEAESDTFVVKIPLP